MVDLGRLMVSIRQGVYAGIQTGINTYNARNHIAENEYDFTVYDSRLARYWHNRRYADNTIYHSVNAYADLYKVKESLYKGIRGLRNPVMRLAQMEAAKIYGGIIDYENFENGALIIDDADDTLKESVRHVLRDSNFDTTKTMWVREGSIMGDSALKIIDDTQRGKVRMEILDPRKVYDVQFDAVGNVKMIDIRYDRYDPDTKKWYEYRETIDKEWFRTYRDGELYAYTEDGDGQPVPEWQNPYGFVPVQWTQHVNTTLGFGLTSWHHVRHKIDNMNDLATLIHDNVRKVVNTKWGLKGAGLPPVSSGVSTITVTDDNRDKSPIVELGENGELVPIAFPLNIPGALQALVNQEQEIERDLPQLALQRLRETAGDISGVSVRNLFGDAIDIFEELQGNYRVATRQAIQMAISIGAFRRYDGYQSYNLDSFKSGALDFDVKVRELYADRLDKRTHLEMTATALSSNAPRLMLKQLDYGEDDIDEALSTAESETELKALAIKKTLGVPESQLILEMGYDETDARKFAREKMINQAMAIRTTSNRTQSAQNDANNNIAQEAPPNTPEIDNEELVA